MKRAAAMDIKRLGSANAGAQEAGESLSAGIEEYLQENLYKATYDEALLNWGIPKSTAHGEQIFVAAWRRGSSSKSFSSHTRFALRAGWELKLCFTRDTSRLIAWSYGEP